MCTFLLRYSLIFMVLVEPVLAEAQTKPDGRDRQDEKAAQRAAAAYEDLGYRKAIPLFEADSQLSLKQMAQLANSYRLNHDTENAELWYAQLVALSEEPTYQLYYAQALQSNGRHALAKVYFDKYADATGGDDGRGAAFAKTIDSGVAHTEVDLRNEEGINTVHLDFSPTIHGDEVVFVSSRPLNRVGKGEKDIWIDDNFMSLWTASRTQTDGLLGAPEAFAAELETEFHEGPLCFDRTGKRLFFTRNTYNRGKRRNSRKGVMRLNIYTSVHNSEGWSKPVELPWNTDDYEEAHPSLSDDGITLFFASNRPDGYGGMDLYASTFAGGVWGEPTNLGPEVNTPGNEAFPFVHPDGTLYFASDGLGGLGGMDVWRIPALSVYQLLEPVDSTAAARPVVTVFNLGTPFNSPKDDFGYVLNREGTLGYFTSARDGGLGKDDIYSFTLPTAPLATVEQALCLTTGEEGAPSLAGILVQVTRLSEETVPLQRGADQDDLLLKLKETNVEGEYALAFRKTGVQPLDVLTDQGTRVTTDADGQFRFSGVPGERYELTIDHPGFVGLQQTVVATETGVLNRGYCLTLVPAPVAAAAVTTRLRGRTMNKFYGNKLPRVELTLVDLCTGEETTIISDAEGQYDFGCVPCGCEYEIRGNKKNFVTGQGLASTMGKDCAAVACGDGGVVETDISLMPLSKVSRELAATTRPEQGGIRRAPDALGGGLLHAGAILELRNIFYDFDQSYIRPDARGDLDHVVALMQAYPAMRIELGSHTDARGRRKYNKELSQRRAESARLYLVRQGVDNRRIRARGYGEGTPRNDCYDFVKCSEFEHQVNRRTEIKIISMGSQDQDVEIRYPDNAPTHVDPAHPVRSLMR